MTHRHGFILVVGDDDAVRETMVEVLEDAKYVVRAARNGREALDTLAIGRLVERGAAALLRFGFLSAALSSATTSVRCNDVRHGLGPD